MGKTENFIWLDRKLLSPYEYYQFGEIPYRDVIKFLKMFTDIKISEIENMRNTNINNLKEN